MSTDSAENRESDQSNQECHCDTGHTKPSGDQRTLSAAAAVVWHQRESPRSRPEDKAPSGSARLQPTTTLERSPSCTSTASSSFVIDSEGDVTTATIDADDVQGGPLIVRVPSHDYTIANAHLATATRALAGAERNPRTATTSTITTIVTTTTASSHSRRRSSPSPSHLTMGLHHAAAGVNGHALPLRNRDAPRNPGPLPAAPSAPTLHHRERLIGPVIAWVAPPSLRMVEAQRERQRLSSVTQRLMRKPVKRKLWEVDHDKLGPEIEAEYKQLVEEDEKRFKERWEELGSQEMPNAPRFYYSEVITPNRKGEVTSSPPSAGHSAPATSSSSSAAPVASASGNPVPQTSSAKDAKTTGDKDEAERSTSSSSSAVDNQQRSNGSPDLPKSSSGSTPEGTPKKQSQLEGGVLLSEKQSFTSNKRQRTSSDTPSPASVSSTSSSLNLSTSSRSSSGVSSLESTPTQTVAPTAEVDTPSLREVTPTAGRIAPTQEIPAPTQRPTTRSCRQRRAAPQRPDPGAPRKHLRM